MSDPMDPGDGDEGVQRSWFDRWRVALMSLAIGIVVGAFVTANIPSYWGY